MKKIFLLIFILTLTSCKNQNNSSLKINIVNEISSLDPRKARDLNSIAVMKMLYEGLTRIKKNGEIDLCLAKKIDISEDKKTYTFHLKKSFWSNKKEVTSYDFEYSLKQSLKPSFPSAMCYKLFIIKNAKKAKKGKIPIDEVGIKTKGPKILIIRLKQPAPYFLELLTLPCFFPVFKNIDKTCITWGENETTYIANGPFFIKKWKHNDKIELVKNNLYWDKKNVKLKNITLHMVSQQTELKMFEAGQLDWAGSPFSSLPIDSLKELSKQKNFHKKPFLGTSFLRINSNWLNKKLPKDLIINFKKSLSENIDREAIVKHVLHNTQKVAFHLLPPQMNISCKIEETNEKNIYDNFNFSIKLMYSNGDNNHLVAQAIQRTWEKNLKIKVKLEPLEPKVYFNRLYSGKYEIAMGSWIADFNDAINFLEVFKFKNNGTNSTGWENYYYKKLLDLADKEKNDIKRNLFFKKAQEILINQKPIIPIYHLNMLFLKSKKIKNVFISKVGHADFRWAYLEN